MTPQRFPIRIGRRSQLVLLLFGVRPAKAYVDLGGERGPYPGPGDRWDVDQILAALDEEWRG